MNNLFRNLTIAYLFIFSLSCDSRSPVDGEDVSGADLSANDLMIDNNGTFTIDVVDLNQDESVDFAVTPIDEFGGQIINGLTIRFEILDNSPDIYHPVVWLQIHRELNKLSILVHLQI